VAAGTTPASRLACNVIHFLPYAPSRCQIGRFVHPKRFPSMQTRLGSALATIAFAAAGCSSNSGGETAATPMPPTLPGVYEGRFPCSNCDAIEATLWLRADGRFFLRQTLTDEDGAAGPSTPSSAYALGRWRWEEQAGETVLSGAGPERRLAVLDADHLRLLVASPVEHLLTRDSAPTPFTDRLVLAGESSVGEKSIVFKECLTGLRFAVADAGAYRELRHQHRQLKPRDNLAFTQVEGHLVYVPSADRATTSEVLVVDRIITLKPDTAC